jgi:hypothetical protein
VKGQQGIGASRFVDGLILERDVLQLRVIRLVGGDDRAGAKAMR